MTKIFLDRLFLYNTCLVICGVSMAMTNFFHPLLVVVTGTDCDIALEDASWLCNPYTGQLVYAVLYGITRRGIPPCVTVTIAVQQKRNCEESEIFPTLRLFGFFSSIIICKTRLHNTVPPTFC